MTRKVVLILFFLTALSYGNNYRRLSTEIPKEEQCYFDKTETLEKIKQKEQKTLQLKKQKEQEQKTINEIIKSTSLLYVTLDLMFEKMSQNL